MATELRIKVTKDILEKSKYCGSLPAYGEDAIERNCAVAHAIRDIFPDARVGTQHIFPFGEKKDIELNVKTQINLPHQVRTFIREFDALGAFPDVRAKMNEIEFVVEVPDCVVDMIDISTIIKLVNHPTLEIVV